MHNHFIETYDLTNRAGLSRCFTDTFRFSAEEVYERPLQGNTKTWVATQAFNMPRINHQLGQMVEEALPQAARTSLIKLSLGQSPYVVVLRNMPTGKEGSGLPEIGPPLCAYTLRGLAALLAKQDTPEWENAKYTNTFHYHAYNDTGRQLMHSDYVLDCNDEDCYLDTRPMTNQLWSLLHCATSDEITPTYFIPYTQCRARTWPDPLNDPYVILDKGDIVIFNNIRTLHARGDQLFLPERVDSVSKTRYIIAINTNGPYQISTQARASTALALA